MELAPARPLPRPFTIFNLWDAALDSASLLAKSLYNIVKCETCERQEFYTVGALIHTNLHSLRPFIPLGSYAMPSIVKFLKDRVLNRDPSDALFAAGVEAWKKYEETYESQYLAEAVRNHQAALYIRVPDHPRRPESLVYAATALWAQCKDAVTKESSSTVIAYYNEALRLLLDKPDKHGDRATIYTNLGIVYFKLFRLGKKDPEAFPATRSNIGKAIENYRSALELRPAKNDPDRPISLFNLSQALVQKDSKDGLANAIIHLREAVQLCTTKPTNRPLLISSLKTLGLAYDSHYRHSKDISDVVEKVEVLRRVLNLTDEGKERLAPLVNLTNALGRLCEIEPGRSNDLDEAVLRGREALRLSNDSDNIIHIKALTALAQVISARYVQTTKNVRDLDQAIQYYRKAIDSDNEDGPDAILCSGLASAIYIRCQDFEEVLEGATLEDAISYNQEALQTCPKYDPLYIKIQNNLGSIYLTRFKKSGEKGDLVKGVQAYEDVVLHCPYDDDDYTYYQETLTDAKKTLQETKYKRRRRRSVAGSLRRRRSVAGSLRSRRSVAGSLRSEESSDESCPSRPGSII